jgi:tight adherence protein B
MQSLSRAAADGSSLGIAVGKIGSRLHFNELDAFALALDESERTGAPVVPLVELLARQVAHRNARGRLIRSELASTRATVSVLAMLPVLGVAMSAMFGGDSFRWLLHAGIGRICLVVGLALEMLGLLWIRVIVRRVI